LVKEACVIKTADKFQDVSFSSGFVDDSILRGHYVKAIVNFP